MSVEIGFGRDLPYNEYQGAVNANSPSAVNPFATMADIVSAGGVQHAVAAGTNTYTATIPGVASYADGDSYLIRFTNGNDNGSTININGLGAITLVKQSNVAIEGGDILSNQELLLVYDGTNFQCMQVSSNQLFAYVTNAEGIAITKGQPVYAFGAAGDRMSVKLAYNTSDATSAQTIGIVFSTSIAAGQKGFVIVQGAISGLDTSMYSPGDQLYLGATAGTLTNVKPYAPNHMVYVGIVEKSNAGAGQIYVRTQNGYELDELHDVDLISTPPINGDVLTFNSVTGLWEPQASGASTNIYNSNGTLTGNRFVDLLDYFLQFDGLDGISGGNNTFRLAYNNIYGLVGNTLGNNSGIDITDSISQLFHNEGVVNRRVRVDLNGFQVNGAYYLPNIDGAPNQILTTNGLGVASWQNQAASPAEREIDSSYAYDMSQAAGYTWNGATVGATALVTLNERTRLQTFAGVGQADGCFMNTMLPSYYINGNLIRVDIVVTTNGTGGDVKYFIGLSKPVAGAFAAAAGTLWTSVVHTAAAGFPVVKLSVTFVGTGLLQGDPIAILVYRDPGDVQDTYSGDSYLNTIQVEQL